MAKQKTFVRDSSIPLAATQFETDATFVKPASSKGFIYADPEKVTVKRWANGEYRNNADGTTSTHKMASFGTDKEGFYAAPTVYPKDRKGTKSRASKDWYEAPTKGFAFADTAKARGELYGPFKTQKIADDFSANGYKNKPIQLAASKKLGKKK